MIFSLKIICRFLLDGQRSFIKWKRSFLKNKISSIWNEIILDDRRVYLIVYFQFYDRLFLLKGSFWFTIERFCAFHKIIVRFFIFGSYTFNQKIVCFRFITLEDRSLSVKRSLTFSHNIVCFPQNDRWLNLRIVFCPTKYRLLTIVILWQIGNFQSRSYEFLTDFHQRWDGKDHVKRRFDKITCFKNDLDRKWWWMTDYYRTNDR